MILLLNGAFGIGKTTVARQVAKRLPDSIVVDPEKIGIPLQRASRLFGRSVDDFQDMPRWRALTVLEIRLARLFARNIIVPMAFSNTTYLDQIRRGIARSDPVVRHVCLVAPLEVVIDRLGRRGADPVRHSWQYRRAAECCVAHADAAFAVHLDAAQRTAPQLAEDILGVILAI